MAENTAVTQQQSTAPVPTVNQVKQILDMDSTKKRFTEVLGQKAPQFMTSIVNTLASNPGLKKCSANSILSAALVAATYDLPIDSNLGFSAIVPYNTRVQDPQTKKWETVPVAQFQMMYKGLVQLAIRSGYYEKMNYAVVYQDEMVSYNPITGEVEFVSDFSNCHDRDSGKEDRVAGYYAWFKLKTGFRHDLFMTRQAVENHAKKYSSAYRYDIDKNKKSSLWSTDFETMALKTVIKLLLNKWGILSVDMQRAIEDDQRTYDDAGSASYGDNQPDIVPAEDPFEKKALEEAAYEQEEPEDIGGLPFEEV